MIEKIMILHELKLAGFDISENLEKMYRKYGKEEFKRAARSSGYGFILNTDIFMRACYIYPMREKNLSMSAMRVLCVHFK